MVKHGASERTDIWLAVETATSTGSVAIWKGGLALELSLHIQGAHSERVLPAIDRALEMTETRPGDVTAIVVGSGPGSFTGVRIAASVGKGWAMAGGTRLFAYPSLLAVAAGCGAPGPVCAVFDARRGQVYAACYELSDDGPAERLAPGAWRIEDLLAELASRKLKPVFAGAGAVLYREMVGAAFGGATVLPAHLAAPRAASLLWLRHVAPELGRVAEPDAWEPVYVRDWRISEERGNR